MNLMESLVNEIERNAKLVEIYHSIGPAGTIGATLIQMTIDEAKAAIQSGDLAQMIRAHEVLKGNKE
jgi:hypothetical protein